MTSLFVLIALSLIILVRKVPFLVKLSAEQLIFLALLFIFNRATHHGVDNRYVHLFVVLNVMQLWGALFIFRRKKR